MAVTPPVCDFGWKAPDFTLPSTDGRQVSLGDVAGTKGTLVMFICNHCPYVVAIADRLAQDANELMSEGINVLAVMSNDYQYVSADNPENMKKFAQHYDFKFPYLVDETQEVGKAYGAVCTPDFFGLNKEGELQYRGRLDSAGIGDATDRTPELVNAMRQIAETGHGPKKQMASMGCSIKWR